MQPFRVNRLNAMVKEAGLLRPAKIVGLTVTGDGDESDGRGGGMLTQGFRHTPTIQAAGQANIAEDRVRLPVHRYFESLVTRVGDGNLTAEHLQKELQSCCSIEVVFNDENAPWHGAPILAWWLKYPYLWKCRRKDQARISGAILPGSRAFCSAHRANARRAPGFLPRNRIRGFLVPRPGFTFVINRCSALLIPLGGRLRIVPCRPRVAV
jgi:hypothetical protein